MRLGAASGVIVCTFVLFAGLLSHRGKRLTLVLDLVSNKSRLEVGGFLLYARPGKICYYFYIFKIQIQIQKYFILVSVEYVHFYTFKIRH